MKFGTHNLHDYNGTATPFAHIIVFTEAIPKKVKKELRGKGYRVVVCWRQRDLVVAYKKGLCRRVGIARYKKIHGGVPKVTPHRGTFWFNVKFKRGRYKGQKAIIIAEHRINAAFPPYKRGEPKFRREKWNDHTKFTVRLIRRSKRRNKIVLAAGDLNTIPGVLGYQGELVERGNGFDRVGTYGVDSRFAVLRSKRGSDHKRLFVIVK